MKLLKTVFTFTLPLSVMLIIFSIYLVVNQVVHNYKTTLTDDYIIIVTADAPLTELNSVAGKQVKEATMINQDDIIKNVEDTLSESTIKILNKKLPLFYRISLSELPTKEELDLIREELKGLPNVQSIEMFLEDHKQTYSFLIMIQDMSFVLFTVVLAFSALLVIRQVRIWFFEHSRRIKIMELHGGSILYSSKPIVKVIIISSILSCIITFGVMYSSLNSVAMLVQPEILPFIPSLVNLQFDFIKIVLLSFAIPVVTFMGLLIKYKLK